jgi:hypothetical protein
MKKIFLLLLLLAGLSIPAHAQATNVYVTPSGTALGNCPAGSSQAPNLTPTQFSNSSYWGTGSTQIGPGTKVLLCSNSVTPFSFTPNTTAFTIQGSGTAGHPIWILADTGTVIQSGQFANAFYNNQHNYIILDGGLSGGLPQGIIQNTAMGTGLTYQTNGGTSGIYSLGQNVIVRNWKIQNMYLNLGSAQVTCTDEVSPNCDTHGAASIDIDINDGLVMGQGSSTVSVCNNYLGEASIGIQVNTIDAPGGTGTQATCQANNFIPGTNIYLNTFNHHHWDMSVGGSGLGPWIYANDLSSDHTQWDNPHDNGESYSYHQDGIIAFGYQYDVPSLNKPVIFNNLFNINFGPAANGTGEVFCAVGAFVFGSGDACTVFNNLFITNGYGAEPINTNGQQGFYGSTIQITSNVLTLTGPGGWTTESDNPTGKQLAVSGCTNATFLNGQTITVASAAGAGPEWTGMTASFTHANYGPTSDTCQALYSPSGPDYFWNNTFYNVTSAEFGNSSPMPSSIEQHINNIYYITPSGVNYNAYPFVDDTGFAPTTGGVVFNSDYNIYFLNGITEPPPGGAYIGWNWGNVNVITQIGGQTFATWQADCNCDAHSLLADPIINNTGHITGSSPVATAGENLSANCVTYPALCYDKPPVVGIGGDTIGQPRPGTGGVPTGPWSEGAYNAANSTNMYIGQSALGRADGSDCADTLPYTFFNNAANWVSTTPTASQIGPGKTVHLCGTIMIPVNTVGLIPQGSGTATNPIIILFEPGAILESPFFKGGPYDGCGYGFTSFITDCGGISIHTNYIIVDGGTNGQIMNTQAGTNKAYNDMALGTVSGPTHGATGTAVGNGTSGVFVTGTGNKVRNVNIHDIYDHISGNINDDGGNGADMIVDSFATSVSFCNNILADSRIGLQSSANDPGVGGYGTQNICQSNTTIVPGFNFYLNNVENHAWDLLVNGGAPAYYYANYVTGSHANWLQPADNPNEGVSYHQDGFITFGYLSNDVPVVTYPFIYNNTMDAAVPVGGNDTAFLFPVSGGPNFGATLEGSNSVIFNNIIIENAAGTMPAYVLGGNSEFDITSTSITGGVMTLSGYGNIAVGQYLLFSGLTNATFLNGNYYQIQTCAPCTNNVFSVSNTITINVPGQANHGSIADTGKGWEQVGAAQLYYNDFHDGIFGQLGSGIGIYTMEGNATWYDYGGSSQAQQWYYLDDYYIALATSIARMDSNAYGPITGNAYPTPGTYWDWGASGPQPSLSAWQTWCNCDANSQVITAPNLNLNSNYQPTDSTLLYGDNRSDLCTRGGAWAFLCYDHPAVVGKGGDTIGTPRPATGPWYVGARWLASSSSSQAATPTISLPAGTYTSPQTITLGCTTPSSTIYYTIDGSTPTTSSPAYSGTFSLTLGTVSVTLNAMCVAGGYTNSAVASNVYNESLTATPVVTPTPATYVLPITINMSCATPGSSIYYTTNGVNPTSGSTLYTGSFSLASPATIKSICLATGYAQGLINTSLYSETVAATPTISPAAGALTSTPQLIQLNCSTPGGNIYYTTDSSTPTTSSTLYTGQFSLGIPATVKAICAGTGYVNSSVASASYTLLTAAATPSITPAGGAYTAAQTINISCSTPSSSIYYTINNSTPTTSSTLYTGSFLGPMPGTVKAICIASGYSNSAVASNAYTLQSIAATPVITPSQGALPTPQTIAMSCSTGSSTIYYTLDGSTPTTSSTVYSTSFSYAVPITIKALCVASGYTNSAIASNVYTQALAATPVILPVSGQFTSPQTITMSCSTGSSSIYYTIDGSTPTTSSTLYSSGFSNVIPSTIKAICTAAGYATSAIGVTSYTLLSPGVPLPPTNLRAVVQ